MCKDTRSHQSAPEQLAVLCMAASAAADKMSLEGAGVGLEAGDVDWELVKRLFAC